METCVLCVTHCVTSTFSIVELEANSEEDLSEIEEQNSRKKKKRMKSINHLPAFLVSIFLHLPHFLIQIEGTSINHNRDISWISLEWISSYGRYNP